MNYKTVFGIAFFFSILFSNCTNSDNQTDNDLIIYQQGNTTITLLDVNDSRCPTNLDCVWQGNGAVEMRIDTENDTENFTLNTLGNIIGEIDYPATITIFDLNIELIDLQPYPDGTTPYLLEDYTIVLEVTN